MDQGHWVVKLTQSTHSSPKNSWPNPIFLQNMPSINASHHKIFRKHFVKACTLVAFVERIKPFHQCFILSSSGGRKMIREGLVGRAATQIESANWAQECMGSVAGRMCHILYPFLHQIRQHASTSSCTSDFADIASSWPIALDGDEWPLTFFLLIVLAGCSQVKKGWIFAYCTVFKGKGALVTTLHRQAILLNLDTPLESPPPIKGEGCSSKLCTFKWMWNCLQVELAENDFALTKGAACLGQNYGTALRTRGSSSIPVLVSFIIFQILLPGKRKSFLLLEHTHTPLSLVTVETKLALGRNAIPKLIKVITASHQLLMRSKDLL